MDLTEGGIRVPWIAHWPGAVAPGGVSHQHCMTMDWSATLLDAAGVSPHPDYPLDGISLMPVLRDAGHVFRRPLHWRMNHRGQCAIATATGSTCGSTATTTCSTSPRTSASAPTGRRASRSGWRRCARPGTVECHDAADSARRDGERGYSARTCRSDSPRPSKARRPLRARITNPLRQAYFGHAESFPLVAVPELAPPDAALLRGELGAALTVAVVMVPQSVAYASLAGMPLVTGLYATFLPALAAVLFSGSTRLSVAHPRSPASWWARRWPAWPNPAASSGSCWCVAGIAVGRHPAGIGRGPGSWCSTW